MSTKYLLLVVVLQTVVSVVLCGLIPHIAADGRPNNASWRLVLDFIDGVDVEVIDPQDYQAPDECDLEIRRSDTDSHDIYAGGHHWRKLSAADIAAFNSGGTTPPPPPPPPPTGTNIDPLGVKMIYPTKENGQTWFQNDNPEADGRLISQEVITRVGDYFISSAEIGGATTYLITTDFGDLGQLPCAAQDSNWSTFASQGNIFTNEDWRDVEMTILVYPQELNTTAGVEPDDFDFGLQARSSSFELGQPTGCCGIFRYAAALLTTNTGANIGRVRFNKTMSANNPNRTENFTQTVKTTFYRTWTGMKFCVYNTTGPNNEAWITLELWLCPSDLDTDIRTNWTKVASFIDKGNNWGTVGESCNGTAGQAFTWGTPTVSMNYNNMPELRWKKFSVREIDPNADFPGDPPDPPDDPCDDVVTPPPPPPPPPATGSAPLYRFISWGDNDTTTDATNVLSRIFLETGVSQYLFAGDGPYASSGDNWVDMMSQYFSTQALKNMLMLAQGNHEHTESESQTTENDIEAWFPGLNNPVEGLEWLAQKKVGNAYVIVMNSQDPNIDEEGGDQYNYVQNALNTAKSLRTAGQIDWIITMVHKSWFNLLGSNPAYVTARHTYAAMFNDAQVDFMFHGHNHSYAIWRPIVDIAGNDENTAAQSLFTMATDGVRYDMSKPHGAFYIINGNGGHEINSWGEDPADFPNVIYANDTVFGYTVLDIQGKQATITAKNVSGAVLFSVRATRGVEPSTGPDPPAPPPPPDPDPCEPPPPPPPPESVFNDLTIVYNINSDSDGCLCNDPGFTPPPTGQEPCPTGQVRNTTTGLCEAVVNPPPPPPGGGGSGGENTSIYNINYSGPGPDDLRMASESGDDHFYLKVGAEITGTSSPLYNKNIKRIEWPLRKSGNPTGDATVVIRKGSDNSIAKTLGTIPVSDLTSDTEYKPVENTSTSYSIEVGDRVLIEYSDGDDNDYIIAWAVDSVSGNATRLTKQDNTMNDDEYRTRDQECSFRAFA